MANARTVTVDDDAHIAEIVGPIVREIYGDSAELGHYKLAIAVYKLSMEAGVDLNASLRAEVPRLKESLEILAERGELEKMRADIAEEKVARLEKERDEWKAEEYITSELLEAAETRIREIEGGE